MRRSSAVRFGSSSSRARMAATRSFGVSGLGFRQVDLIENVTVNLLYNWAYIFILGVQGIRVYKADFLLHHYIKFGGSSLLVIVCNKTQKPLC